MIRDLNPTIDFLRAITAKFDLTAVFTLTLSEKGISKINAIPECVNVVTLNLSFNKLTNINGLEALKQMTLLNISNNKIK